VDGEAWGVSSRAYAGRAPRHRVRRRVGPSRVRWDRVGRVALVLVLFGVMVSYLNPVVNLVDAWRDSEASKDRLVELKSENRKLEEQVRDAADPLVVEREARRLGMVRPGEHAYAVRGLND
jgi:cell division protein FtsB